MEDEKFSGNTHFTVYGIRAFDAVFAAALALNNSIANLKRLNLTLADFNFEDYNTSALFANEIRNQMKKLIFQGATVSVHVIRYTILVCIEAQLYIFDPATTKNMVL